MQRITSQEYAELISRGLGFLPKRIIERVEYAEFFTGTDPLFAGLLTKDLEIADDGRSYRSEWCVVTSHHQQCDVKQTTVVIPEAHPIGYPTKLLPILIVHELGHVLHEAIRWASTPKPVTDYAKTNSREAFAEAFTLWVCPNYGEYYEILNPVDEETKVLFHQLSY